MHEQYFSDQSPAEDSQLQTIWFEARGHRCTAHVSSKVFSATRLDIGTKQLLDAAPELPSSGNFLDLGCGWGPIAITMAKESPEAHVWAVDVNSRAVDLTARNAVANNCVNVRALKAEDALAEAQARSISFDVVWSNPPIRVGKEALHQMLLTWLSLLSDAGRAYLVIQRNLGADSLAAWLNAEGFRAEKIASKKGFRLIEVRKNTSGTTP